MNLTKKGVYCIKNKNTGKLYIGSTQVSFGKRWNQHLRCLRTNSHKNAPLQNSWNKHGEHCFEFLILDEIEEGILKREQEFINENSENLYNLSPVTASQLGFKWSEEQKNARRGSNNPMIKAGIDRKGPNNPMFGKTMSKKRKEEVSEFFKGSNHPRSKLTEKQVLEIRRLSQEGLSRKVLAKKYNVSPSSIGNIVKRISWTHV